MFTGIIEEIGTISAVRRNPLEAKLTILLKKYFPILK